MLYCGAVGVSFLYSQAKHYALGYHTRDYPFYFQFATKVLDPAIANRYTINPFGYNFLGMDGVEGMTGLYQTIHLEPIKFLYAICYWITGTPLSIFLLIGVIYFFPLLYLGWQMKLRDRLDAFFVVGVVLLFILFPATNLVVANDLRPYSLLLPSFLLTFLSIQLEAPHWHTVSFFCAMFLCREEALVLAILLMGYALFKTHNRAEIIRKATHFGLIWGVWLSCTLLYYRWAGYKFNPFLNSLALYVEEMNYRLAILIMVTAIAGYCLFVFLWVMLGKKRRRWLAQRLWIKIVLFVSLFYPLTKQVIDSRGRQYSEMELADAFFSIFEDFALRPKYSLSFILLIFLFVIIGTESASIKLRRTLNALLVLFLCGAIYLQSVDWMPTSLIQYRNYQQEIAASQPVWTLRANTDQYDVAILSDLNTYQAFANYENVTTFERLPWAIEASEQRHFPANLEQLVKLVDSEVDYIVTTRKQKSLDAIAQVLEIANVEVTESISNEHYQVLRIDRK